MPKVMYPGTFDPPHFGHLHIINRLAKQFKQVEIAIGYDLEKPSPLFSVEERVEFLRSLTATHSHVGVHSFCTLLVEHAKSHHCSFLVRSICNIMDYERERTFAYANRELAQIETLFLFPDPSFQFIRSSVLRDIAMRGQSVAKFVPDVVEKALLTRFSKKKN